MFPLSQFLILCPASKIILISKDRVAEEGVQWGMVLMLNHHRMKPSEDYLPHQLFTKPNVVNDKSKEVKTPSNRGGKDLAEPAKMSISGGKNMPNIQFK